MKIIDISWPLTPNVTEYKDRNLLNVTPFKTIAAHGTNEVMLTMANHTGTHIDAPFHALEAGKTLEQIPLSTYVGQCRVLDLTQVTDGITKEALSAHDIKEHEIIVCKTKNSFHTPTAAFDPSFIFLTAEGAQWCVEKRIKAIGVDYLGIERGQQGHPTHKTLLTNNIGLIEGLRLEHVQPGSYFLCCLPLALHGVDGAPARAILLQM